MVFFRLKIRLWDFMFFGCNEISLFPCEIFCCIIIWCYWRDVNSSYCDWRVQSGVWGWWWWCDVKMVGRWCLKNAEVVRFHAFCEMPFWDFMPFGPPTCESELGRKGVGDGIYVEKGRGKLVLREVWVCLLCRPRYFYQGCSAFFSCAVCEWTLSPFLAAA